METEQNDTQISGNKIESQEGTNEYRVYEHPLLPRRIVKIGFCWPALIVGPAYLIYKRLWVSVVVWMVAIGLVLYLANDMFQTEICNGEDTYCQIDPQLYSENMPKIKRMIEGAVIIGLILLGFFTNSIWEKDLINRGYNMIKSIRARSMDDALAILKREENPTAPSA